MPSTVAYVLPLAEDLADCLKKLELFINNEEIDIPDLIKIAMITLSI